MNYRENETVTADNLFFRRVTDRKDRSLMKEIQYEIVREIAVLSTGDSGYTKEINLIAWNGNEPKYDIRSFSPAREKCGKGITLTKAEAEKLLAALKKELKQ